KGKTFFRNNQLFSKLFFKNLSAFKKNRTSRTPANHRQSTLICGGKDMAFIGYDPNISESIFHLFCYRFCIILPFNALRIRFFDYICADKRHKR
ncbi:hypothetical protein, partial [uncultured Alistipes sp.]|uniref:hypothetical protein n=2 Tax=uncultured Alistipes sp. TaxID=538949 RepID=UPI002666673D